MAYLSEEKKIEQVKNKQKEQELQRKRIYSRDVFLQFLQNELKITLTPEQRAKLLAYINYRFDVCQCCVLYSRSEKVRNMLTQIGLPENTFGTTEFIIMKNFSVKYSPDYQRLPLKPVKATFSNWRTN